MEIAAGGRCPAPDRLSGQIPVLVPLCSCRYCRAPARTCCCRLFQMFAAGFAMITFVETCFPSRQRQKGRNAQLFFQPYVCFPPPHLPPHGQIIHINYCFPAVLLLTFQWCTLFEPVERYEHARSLPTHSSKQESDTASIRPGLPARCSIQPET